MVPPTTPAAEAQKVMRENNVRHLPVVGDGKRLLGLITREKLGVSPTDLGSLNVWEITRYLSNLTVKDMMLKHEDVITIEPDAALEDAAQIMAKRKIGCLVVLEENVVVGIITETDMLVELNELLGGGVPGVRKVRDVPKDDLVAVLEKIEGQEIIDVRETT
jgi:CBS domain-containing protein